MPLRRHAASRKSGSRIQPQTPKSSRANGGHSSVVSSSHSTPSRHHSRSNVITPSPNGNARATLGDLLASSRPAKSIRTTKHVIELLDSSDDEWTAAKQEQPQQNAQDLDLDDVVTPELPPADAAAPAIPESLAHLSASPEPQSIHADVDDELVVESTQLQLDVAHNKEPLPPPTPPPDPLENQRPIIDREELDMQINALMTQFDAKEASDSDLDDEDYEERRQRKLRENEVLLAMLGLAPSANKVDPYDAAMTGPEGEEDQDNDDEPVQTEEEPSRGRGRPKKRVRDDSSRPPDGTTEARSLKRKKYDRRIKFAEDGTTKSAPPRGEIFDLAYVDINALRDRARNDYVYIRDVPDIRPEDLITWSEDEEEEEDDDPAEVAGPENSDSESRDEGPKRFDTLGRLITKKRKKQPDFLPDGTVMTTCHQCRRKTGSPKVRCHRMREGVQCPLMYCDRCITVRYGLAFDPNDQTFHCPRCLGYCNCSICLRRSGFGDVVHSSKHRILALTEQLRRLASEKGVDTVEGRIGAILAEKAALDMELPTPSKKRARPKVEAATREPRDPATPALGPPKRRGRPPKKKQAHWSPVKIELDLSDEVAEGEVLSQLEEYTLGRLNVARRVLKLIAAKRAPEAPVTEARKANLVVKLKVPSQRSRSAAGPVLTNGVLKQERKTSNYHDMEKDVWVRSAADLSTCESESGSEIDELDSDDMDDDDAKDEAEDVFEEGRKQVFAASYLQERDDGSTAASQSSSPLTSLNGSLSQSSVALFEHDDEDKSSLQRLDAANDSQTFTQGSAAAVYPQTMQQLALAVLGDHDSSNKAIPADILRLQDSPAFPTSSGSEAGQLSAMLEPEPTVGTPLMFAETAFQRL